MKKRNYRALALLLSATIASQPISVSAATIKEVLEPDNVTDVIETEDETVSNGKAMSDNDRLEMEHKEEVIDNTPKGQVRNGLVKYEDQDGSITVNNKKVIIGLGEMAKLEYSGADVRNIALVSNRPNIVQVDIDGNIYGIKAGSATITAWYNGKKVRTKVKVTRQKEKGSVNVKEFYTLEGQKTRIPSVKGVSKKDVKVTSEDVSYTKKDLNDNTFSENKKVLTLETKYGTATVDNYTENPEAKNTEVTLGINETKTLITDGVVEGVVWKSRKNAVARVDSLGRVTGIKPGKAKIVAKVGKKKLVYEVTVDKEKVPDVDTDAVVTQVRMNRFTSVNLSAGGRVLAVVKTGSYDGKQDPYTSTQSVELFSYKVIHHEGAADTVVITGLTDKGNTQETLNVPAVIEGMKVESITAVFPNKDVYFDKDLDISAILDDIKYQKYSNGDYEYRYKLQDGKLFTEIMGMSESGKAKNEITIPSSINDRKVISATNALIDNVGKDVTIDSGLADVLKGQDLGKYEFHKGDFIYHFASDGESVDAVVTALSDEGKEKAQISVDGKINGSKVEIGDGLLKDTEGKVLEFDESVEASSLPSAVNGHTFISEDGFEYRYKVENGEIVAELVGATDELKEKSDIVIPGTIAGKKVTEVKDEVLKEFEGKHVTIADDLADSALTDSYFEHEYVDGDIKYRFIKDKDGKTTVELTGITEEGKKKDVLNVPSTIGGKPVAGLSDTYLKDTEGKNVIIDGDVPTDILPDSFYETTYTTGDYKYIYQKGEDGIVRPVIIGLSDKGKAASSITIPSEVGGKTVAGVSAGIFQDAAGKKVTIDKKLPVKDITDSLSNNNFTDGDFTYRFVKTPDGKDVTVEIMGLSEDGKKKPEITIPDKFAERTVSGLADKVFKDAEGKKVKFADNLPDKAIPESVSEHEFIDGDIKYRFVKDKDGKTTAEATGITENGKAKDIITVPSTIGGKPTSGLSDSYLKDAEGKNVVLEGDVPSDILPDKFYETTYTIDDYEFRYRKGEDGIVRPVVVGLSDAGKAAAHIIIPSKVSGQTVDSVEDGVFADAAGKKVTIDKDLPVKDITDSLSNHNFSYGDYTYRFVKNADGSDITVEIMGLSDAGKKKSVITMPEKFADRMVSLHTGSVFKDAAGKTVKIADEVSAGALAESMSTNTYHEGDVAYRYVKNADGSAVNLEVINLSEEGKQKEKLTLDVRHADRNASMFTDGIFKDAEKKELILTDRIIASIVADTISEHQYTAGDYAYHFVADKATGTITALIDGLSEEGKAKDTVTIPKSIGGKTVSEVTADALEDMNGKNVIVSDPSVVKDTIYSEGDFSYKYKIGLDGKMITEITGLSEEGKQKLAEGGKVKIPDTIGGQDVTASNTGLFDEIKETVPGAKLEDMVEVSDDPSIVYDYYDFEFRILSANEAGKRTAEVIGMSRYAAKYDDSVAIPADMKLLGKDISSVTKKAVNSIGDKEIRIEYGRRGVLQKDVFTNGDYEWKFIVSANGIVGAYVTGLTEEGSRHAEEGKLDIPERIENLPVLTVDATLLPHVKTVPASSELLKDCYVYELRKDVSGNSYIEITEIKDSHPDLMELPDEINGIAVKSITAKALMQADGKDVVFHDESILPSKDFKSGDYTYKYISKDYDEGRYVARVELTDVVESAKENGHINGRKQVNDFIDNMKIDTIDPEARAYSITYNLNDKESNSQSDAVLKDAPAGYTAANSDVKIPRPTRSGYTFKGWTTADNDTPNLDVVIKSGSDGHVNLTAHWEADDSTVKVMYLVPRLVKAKSNGYYTEYTVGNYEEYGNYEDVLQHASGKVNTVKDGKVLNRITGKTGDDLTLRAPQLEGFSLRATKVIDDTYDNISKIKLAKNSDVELGTIEGVADSANNKADLVLKPESKNKVVVFVYSRTMYDIDLDLAGGSLSEADAVKYGFTKKGNSYSRTVYYGEEVNIPVEKTR